MKAPKLPAFMFYTGDWLKDPQLGVCSPATRGIWIDAICAMHESDRRGILEGSLDQLSRVLRASPSDVQSAVDELRATGAATITSRNGKITISNRRMEREWEERHSAARRQAKMREKGGGDPKRWTAIRKVILERDGHKCQYCGKKANTVDHIIPKSDGGSENSDNLVACCKSCNMFKGTRTLEQCGLKLRNKSHLSDNLVTPISSSSSSKDPPTPFGTGSLFLIFWEAYPLKVSKEDASKAWAKLHPDQELLDRMLAALDVQVKSRQWQKENGKFVPYPASWLNKRRWEDDLAAYKPSDDSDPVYEEPGSEPALRLETAPDGRRVAFKAK